MKAPAKVKFIGDPKKYTYRHNSWDPKTDIFLEYDEYSCFNKDKIYEAFFLEFLQGDRVSLYVRTDSGQIEHFVHIDDFEVIEDPDNVLNKFEAIVRSKKDCREGTIFGIIKGKEYRAIGLGRNILSSDLAYFVMDESHDNYYYPSDLFDIISDPNAILDPIKGIYVDEWYL